MLMLLAAALIGLPAAQDPNAPTGTPEVVTALAFIDGKPVVERGSAEFPLTGLDGARLRTMASEGKPGPLRFTTRSGALRGALSETRQPVDLVFRVYRTENERVGFDAFFAPSVRVSRRGDEFEVVPSAVFQKVRTLVLLRESGRALPTVPSPVAIPQGPAAEIAELRTGDLTPGLTPSRELREGRGTVEASFEFDGAEGLRRFRDARARNRPVDLEFLFFADGPIRPYFEFLRLRLREARVVAIVETGPSPLVSIRAERAEAVIP